MPLFFLIAFIVATVSSAVAEPTQEVIDHGEDFSPPPIEEHVQRYILPYETKVELEFVGSPDAKKEDSYGANIGIGKAAITVSQYCAFLNAVAQRDEHHLYNDKMETDAVVPITRSGEPGDYHYSVVPYEGDAECPSLTGLEIPITHITWFDAARFCNWVENGEPSGKQDAKSTEDGAYTLKRMKHGALPANPGTHYFLPSDTQWHQFFDESDGENDILEWSDSFDDEGLNVVEESCLYEERMLPESSCGNVGFRLATRSHHAMEPPCIHHGHQDHHWLPNPHLKKYLKITSLKSGMVAQSIILLGAALAVLLTLGLGALINPFIARMAPAASAAVAGMVIRSAGKESNYSTQGTLEWALLELPIIRGIVAELIMRLGPGIWSSITVMWQAGGIEAFRIFVEQVEALDIGLLLGVM